MTDWIPTPPLCLPSGIKNERPKKEIKNLPQLAILVVA
jgi:hypothetical protein